MYLNSKLKFLVRSNDLLYAGLRILHLHIPGRRVKGVIRRSIYPVVFIADIAVDGCTEGEALQEIDLGECIGHIAIGKVVGLVPFVVELQQGVYHTGQLQRRSLGIDKLGDSVCPIKIGQPHRSRTRR